MSSIRTLSRAMGRGFVRDKAAVFFSLIFPLIFLVLFGGIFTNTGASRSEIIQVGDVALIDELPDQAREQFDEAIEVTESDDFDDGLEQVRAGDADAAVTEDEDQLVLHFSQADQVAAATVQGVSGFIATRTFQCEKG